MTVEQRIAAAWLAGIRHVLACKGCPLCLLEDLPEPPPPKELTLVEELGASHGR